MRDKITVVSFVISAVAICLGVGFADPVEPTEQTATIQPQDLLRVTISGLTAPKSKTELKKRVDEKGRISLPGLPVVDLKDKTVAEAQKAIDQAYAESKRLGRADSRVTRVETGDKPSVPPGPISVGDHLEFFIWDLNAPGEELRKVLIVSESGEITLPLVGQLNVVRESESAAERGIAAAYEAKGILFNPMVSLRRISKAEAMEGEKQSTR